MQETPVRFLGWEDPLEKREATHSSIPYNIVSVPSSLLLPLNMITKMLNKMLSRIELKIEFLHTIFPTLTLNN